MPQISAVILTYNEEKNIERCLLSIKDIADDVLVVDSFSTDNTENICKKFNVRFVQHEFEGYIEQKNWAVSQTKFPHILSLDADEVLSDKLKESILEVKNNWKYDGYYFNRLTNYCGKWIKHTSWYPSKKLRLWDSNKGKWEGINPHDIFILERGATQKYLKGDLLHYSYYSIQEHIEQINKFSNIVALAYFKKGTKVNLLKIIIHPLWRIFRDYFLKAGFLEGFYGLVISVNCAHETFLKYVKLRQLYKDQALKVRNKICFVNSTKTWGGGEKWHYDIFTHLSKKGYNAIMITNKRSELFRKVKKASLKVYNIRISNLSFLNIIKVLKIASILKKEQIRTMIINLSADLKVSGFAAKLAGVKNIIYRRGSAIPIRNTVLNRYIFKNIVTEIIANSEETKKTILSNNPYIFPKDKIYVVYNGINLNKYDKLSSEILYAKKENEIILGNAGRLVKQKAQKYLIEIAKRLKRKGIKFKLLIAGEGKLKNELKQLAKNYGVENEVIFLGFVENIKTFLKSIDIFLLTSLWEGFGYIIVEAMALKKPVIAFNVSSNPEVVENNKTGFLVKYKDINNFVRKVEYLINNKELRDKFGLAGRKNVETIFTFEKTLKNVEEILKKEKIEIEQAMQKQESLIEI